MHTLSRALKSLISAINEVIEALENQTYPQHNNNSPSKEGHHIEDKEIYILRKGKSAEKGKGVERGCRIPPDFDLDHDMLAWAIATTGQHRDWVFKQTENFVDYWRAATGRTATKRDWLAAWRVWIRKASDVSPPRNR